jgi:hypothetical protein
MAKKARVTVEIGPKGKKVVAVAPDWPGLERGGKTQEDAIERLRSYLPRYAPIAKLAGMDAEFDPINNFRVVEEYMGTGSADFWGISFAFSSIDKREMSSDELERELALMQACWAFFDDVRERVSAEMQKGPRGGGRERDHIVRHTLYVENDWAHGVGVLNPPESLLTPKGLKNYRESYSAAIRDYHSQGKMAGSRAKWPLRFLIRHTAFHTLDHAWEMQDKDLTPKK